MGCVTCNGIGRVPSNGVAAGLLCPSCEGTGDREVCRILKAYSMGFKDGCTALRRAVPKVDGYKSRKVLMAELQRDEEEMEWPIDWS